MHGARSGSWLKHGCSGPLNAVLCVPPRKETVRRNVARNGGRVAVGITGVGHQQVGSCIQVIIQNGGVCEREKSVVIVAVPTEWASVFDGAMAGRSWSDDVQILIAVKITHHRTWGYASDGAGAHGERVGVGRPERLIGCAGCLPCDDGGVVLRPVEVLEHHVGEGGFVVGT